VKQQVYESALDRIVTLIHSTMVAFPDSYEPKTDEERKLYNLVVLLDDKAREALRK